MTLPRADLARLERIEAVVSAVREFWRGYWRPNGEDDEGALDIVRRAAEAREDGEGWAINLLNRTTPRKSG